MKDKRFQLVMSPQSHRSFDDIIKEFTEDLKVQCSVAGVSNLEMNIKIDNGTIHVHTEYKRVQTHTSSSTRS